jgi:hypothetical protein
MDTPFYFAPKFAPAWFASGFCMLYGTMSSHIERNIWVPIVSGLTVSPDWLKETGCHLLGAAFLSKFWRWAASLTT